MKPRRSFQSNAKKLRSDSTQAERTLWFHLRRQQLGARFRRQVPLGQFIVDFACFDPLLVVEVDGGQHLESAADRARDAWFRNRGFRVMRFWNHDVLARPELVLAQILAVLEELRRG